MLVRTTLGAVMYPDVLPPVACGVPTVRRLFEDYKAAEVRHYRKTGLFPIMHTVVIHRELVERHPWFAQSVVKAFAASKQQALRALLDPQRINLARVQSLIEEQRAVMGDDAWPYALEPNRTAPETLIDYSHEQGCIPRRPSADELFVESTRGAIPAYPG